MNSPVEYHEDSLTITIPTLNPAATHQLLMKAITIAMRDLKTSEADVRNTLSDVQLCLIPDEAVLARSNY